MSGLAATTAGQVCVMSGLPDTTYYRLAPESSGRRLTGWHEGVNGSLSLGTGGESAKPAQSLYVVSTEYIAEEWYES